MLCLAIYCLPWGLSTCSEDALSKSHTQVKVISSSFSDCPFPGELKSHVDPARETKTKPCTGRAFVIVLLESEAATNCSDPLQNFSWERETVVPRGRHIRVEILDLTAWPSQRVFSNRHASTIF